MAGRTDTSFWLKQHGAGERALARDLAAYFADQADRVADALADLRSPSRADVPKLFKQRDETALLLDVAMPHVAQLAGAGAMAELKQYQIDNWFKGRPTSYTGTYQIKAERTAADYIPDDLPEYIKDSILDFIDELEGQGYWSQIQAATSEQISMVVGKGLEDGLNGDQLAKAIREALGGDTSMTRARAIARTETTGAMNAGHQTGYEYLAEEEGLLAGKTWLSIVDDRTRESHVELNDVTVGVNEDFSVGGSPAPYPGHFSLPAEERVNCRCTTVGAIAD